METVGHHTCKKDGGKSYVLREAPFLSEYSPDKDKIPFLGQGYYFWDNNLEMAKFWGRKHYSNNYFVLKEDLILEKDDFLDLVGNRADMIYFRTLISKFSDAGHDRENWKLGNFIEFFKKLERENEKYKGIFPYSIVRAVDSSNKHKMKQFSFYFVGGLRSYTFLDPRILICFTEKEKINSRNREILVE